MVRLKGNVKMPENMKNILTVINENKKLENKSSALSGFNNLIDPVIIGVYFGLYSSRELPPIEEDEIELKETHDFNVNIQLDIKLLNHLLFCLWIHNNGYPNESSNIHQYRESLYKFMSKLLDIEFYRLVLIPFYLKKADESFEGGPSFLYRLSCSDNVGIKLDENSPEYLSVIFKVNQDDFIEEVIKKVHSLKS